MTGSSTQRYCIKLLALQFKEGVLRATSSSRNSCDLFLANLYFPANRLVAIFQIVEQLL